MQRPQLSFWKALFFGWLVMVAYVGLLLIGTGCKPSAKPPRPSIDIIEDLLHDDPEEAYANLCREKVFVVSNIDNPRSHDRLIHEQIQYWNTALGWEALVFAGPAKVDPKERNYPYISVSQIDMVTEQKWNEQKYNQWNDCLEKKIGGCPDAPTIKLGHFRSWQVERSTSIYVGSTQVSRPVEPKTGRTLFCAEGGQVRYRPAGPRHPDVGTTILHELGHVLGLKHSESEGTVMSPILTADTAKDLRLGDDTIAEITFLYGAEL